MSRTVWVDNAKAIGIYLIVLGHMPILPLKDLIYAFHVPLFLVVTGFLLPINLGEMTLDQLFRRYALLFLKAYLAFSALSICLQVGLHLAKGQPMDLISMIQGGAIRGQWGRTAFRPHERSTVVFSLPARLALCGGSGKPFA